MKGGISKSTIGGGGSTNRLSPNVAMILIVCCIGYNTILHQKLWSKSSPSTRSSKHFDNYIKQLNFEALRSTGEGDISNGLQQNNRALHSNNVRPKSSSYNDKDYDVDTYYDVEYVSEDYGSVGEIYYESEVDEYDRLDDSNEVIDEIEDEKENSNRKAEQENAYSDTNSDDGDTEEEREGLVTATSSRNNAERDDQKLTRERISNLRLTKDRSSNLGVFVPNVSPLSTGVSSLSNRSIMFVHIGKAGGETVKDLLQYACEIRSPTRQEVCYANLPNSTLSDSVRSYLHGTNRPKPLGAINTTTTFLFNVRHPVDRVISWYSFASPWNCNRTISKALLGPTLASCRSEITLKRHTKGHAWIRKFFVQCFPTLEKFAMSTFIDDAETKIGCPGLAVNILKGKGGRGISAAGHMKANYRSYYSKTIDRYPDKEVLVVRTKNLWSDLKNVDQFLGGRGDFGKLEGSKYSHGSEHYKAESRVLSNQSKKVLCCGLTNEMMYYKEILFAAVNLPLAEKESTWQHDIEYCGFSTWDEFLSTCQEISIVHETATRSNIVNNGAYDEEILSLQR